MNETGPSREPPRAEPGAPPPLVGASPAPGAGSPATRTKLGRRGVILIVVVGLLYFAGWIAWAILGPEIEVEVRDKREHSREQGDPRGPGRLTLIPTDGQAIAERSGAAQLSKPSPSRSSVRSQSPIRPAFRSAAASRLRVNWTMAQRSGSGGNGTGLVRT